MAPLKLEKLTRKELMDLTFDLINAFRLVKTPLETALLIQDLLTANEIKQLAVRLRIAKLLIAGEETQRDIARLLRCSTSTVTKVNLWLERGGNGLKGIVQKLPPKYDLPENLPKIPIEFQLPRVLLAAAQYAIATKQNKRLEKFWQNVEDKKLLDKQLREFFDEQFKSSKRKGKTLV
jgi:uncharacterized protein YerC